MFWFYGKCMETTNEDLNFVICIYKGLSILKSVSWVQCCPYQVLISAAVYVTSGIGPPLQTNNLSYSSINKWNRQVYVHIVPACYKYSSNKVRCTVMVHTVYNWRQYLQTPFCELGRLDLWIPKQKSSQLVTAKNNTLIKNYNIKLVIKN